ncbi:MAG: hypothetical protein IPN27_00115 [Cellvibrionales bacterium]|nr:hypothetical protein [Cellvibrionales bacterium]
MKKFLFICSLVAFTGCAGNAPSPQVKEAALNPLICEGKDQCELYWQRAMFSLTITQNIKYKHPMTI